MFKPMGGPTVRGSWVGWAGGWGLAEGWGLVDGEWGAGAMLEGLVDMVGPFVAEGEDRNWQNMRHQMAPTHFDCKAGLFKIIRFC